jgi:hypothetical protein
MKSVPKICMELVNYLQIFHKEQFFKSRKVYSPQKKRKLLKTQQNCPKTVLSNKRHKKINVKNVVKQTDKF